MSGPRPRGLLLAAALQAGAAAFGPAAAQAPTPDPTAETRSTEPAAAVRPRAWSLQVEAPTRLKALLERHLDIARLAELAADAEVSEGELSRLIDAAPAQARELLQTEGYFDAQVQVSVSRPQASAGVADPSAATLTVRVRVEPGALARVDRFTLEVEGDLARAVARGDADARELLDTLRQAWPLRSGAPFRNADWSDAKTQVLTRLRAAGYALASWSGTTAQVDVARRQVRLFLVADGGPLFRAGELSIEGLALHDRRAVQHLAAFDTGTVVTDSLLLDFQDRLLKSGLFEQASVTLETDSADPSAARLRVRVKELSRHQLTTGLGVSSNAGPRVTVEHVDRRVFGWAASARNKAEWGQTRQAWDGELSTHVLADRYRWFTGGTIERLKTDTDTVLNQRLRLGRALESSRIERTQYLQLDRATRRTQLSRTVTEALTANHGWVWRDIDNPLLPTEGETLSLALALGQARSNVSGSAPLARALGRLTAYRPLGAGWFGVARLEAGQVFVNNAAVVTDSLGFRAGGDDSVRGYAYRSLGPLRDGAVASGKVLAAASLEVARPLSDTLPSVWGAVFVDAGQAADRWGDWRPVVGSGLGLRWRSPVGPLKLDLAYGHELRKLRLHFSVGIVF
ncbi:MAG: BamA/TamA family outer membrane protein [Rubrivivax sp.]|nr:BamA/TamA family outer membrane protein [Rubrivivax sp.]